MSFLEDIFARLESVGDTAVLCELHDPQPQRELTGRGLLKQIAEARAFLAARGLKHR